MKKNYIDLYCQNKMAIDPKKKLFRSDHSNSIPKHSSWITGVFAAATLLLSGGNSFAQTNIASYKFEKSVGNTYVPITGGTKLFPSGTSSSYDNDLSSAINLPSPFAYGGVVVSTVYVSANGFITLGAASTGTNYTPLSSLGSTTGAISAFGQDGSSSTATGAVPEVRYQDLGTEFVVQYQDHANYFNRSTEKLNFQIRLVYATGEIKIVYGTNTNPGTSTSGATPQVGIRGNSVDFATNVNPLMIGNVLAGTMCDWSNALTGNAAASTMLFTANTNVNVKIPNGLQYTWTPGTQAPVRTFAATSAITNNGATVSWTAPAGATTYNVQYRDISSCDWTDYSGNPVSGTTISFTGLTQNTTYQFRVQAVNGTEQSIYSHIPNSAGNGNGYETTGSFKTLANCTSTVSGLASSQVTPDSATISWAASSTAPNNGYEYYYSTTSTAPVIATTPSGSVGAGVITANLSGLNPGTQYYYWVRANCDGIDKGDWSSSANFTTSSLCPTVSAPSSSATGTSITPTFTWAASPGVTGYRITIGTTAGGNDILDNHDLGNVTTYTYNTPLAFSTKYYYKISAYYGTLIGTTCTERNFTTQGPCPTVTYPAANATLQPVTPTINWNGIATATNYTLTVGTTAGGTDIMNNVDVGNVTTYTFTTPLTLGTKYYYKVNTNTSTACTERNFTVHTIAAPSNDNCGNAIALTPGNTFASNSIVGTTLGATLTMDPTATTSCQSTRFADTWYSVVVPASGSITIETKSATGSSVSDTILGVYSGTCGSLVSVGCNDDNSPNAFSKLNLTTTSGIVPGQTLLIGVWNYSSTNNGNFQISAYDASLATSEVSQVKNDLKVYPNPFADVLTISDISNVKSVSIIDLAGRVVKTIDNPSSQLQLSELKSGMFMIVLNMKDGSKQTIKAIKK